MTIVEHPRISRYSLVIGAFYFLAMGLSIFISLLRIDQFLFCFFSIILFGFYSFRIRKSRIYVVAIFGISSFILWWAMAGLVAEFTNWIGWYYDWGPQNGIPEPSDRGLPVKLISTAMQIVIVTIPIGSGLVILMASDFLKRKKSRNKRLHEHTSLVGPAAE